MLFDSILLYKNLLKSHWSYDKKWTYGRYSLTVEATSSSFGTVGVTMTARAIVDHCAYPWDLTNDIGTNESAHLEIISQSGIPNGEIIAATQSSSFCYAGRHASSLESKKTYRWNRIDSQRYALYSLCVTSMRWVSGCGAVGSALPWGGRGSKFKSRHSGQTKGRW